MIEQLIVNGLVAGGIYALIAIGFALIYRTVRFFHFAHGAVYTVGAYAGYSVVVTAGMHPIIGFFLPRPLRESSGYLLSNLSTVLFEDAKPQTSFC